ncbi:GHKL domain-containing protein [Enterococcus sp. BWB1-3]|uniref:sensor histidine kinase n=1 Tax=Enterococcus sp. BWB1-3 TaxID=2787713 RepID=UPI001924563E|nr:GHKL domain-containing protein [Enterococcus sp. BWB1-3]MBL1228781.1 GHKL domain-containing protein [Enterococcus sp. BWB1-3]
MQLLLVTIQGVLLFIFNFILFRKLETVPLKMLFFSVVFIPLLLLVFTYLGALSGIFMVVLLIAINFFYTREFLISIIIPILLMILSIIFNYIITDIIHYFFNYDSSLSNRLSDILVISTLPVCFSFLVLYAVTYSKGYQVLKRLGKENSISLLFIVIFLITLIVFYINITITDRSDNSTAFIRLNLWIFVLYLLMSLLISYFYIQTILRSYHEKSKAKEHEQLMEYTKKLETTYDDIRKFKHDYVNILGSLAGLINKGDLDTLKQYYEEKVMVISESMKLNDQTLDRLKQIQVYEIKGLISSKIIRAQELGINVHIEVEKPITNFYMDTLSLSRALGIILDNAIEETETMDEGKIELGFFEKEETLMIVVSNSCRESEYKLFELMKKDFSTKGENRGLGLSNLKEIIDKQNSVSLETEIKNDTFIQLLEIRKV